MEISLNNVIIELSPQICDVLSQYIQYGYMPESGGIILGKFLPAENKYIITEVTKPSIWDKWGHVFFVRNRHPAQKIINKRWKESYGQVNYIGEWHTHGCNVPVPSETDKNLIRTIFKDQSNVWPNIIMIILGRTACYVAVTTADSAGEIAACQYIEGENYALLFHR